MSKTWAKTVLIFLVTLFSLLAVLVSNDSSKFTAPFGSVSPTIAEDEVWGQTPESVLEKEYQTQPVVEENNDLKNEETLSSTNDQVSQGYRVVKVVDGDTFDVEIDGKIERLRMIGIDTPETVDPRKTVQCFGKEASNRAKEILSGQFVSLEADESQGDRDKYGRLLRYAILADGTSFGLFMISEGYAHEYTYRYPYKYQVEHKQAEVEARENNRGLWSPDTCSGNK